MVVQHCECTECHKTQFSSVAHSCPILCYPVDCRTPGVPVHHQLPELAQTHVHWVSDDIQPSHPVIPFSSRLQSFSASRSFPVSQFSASGGPSIAASASASVLPMNIQDWFPLGLLTGLLICKSMNCSTPGFPVHHQLLELAQTHIHRVADEIQLSKGLSRVFSNTTVQNHQFFGAQLSLWSDSHIHT